VPRILIAGALALALFACSAPEQRPADIAAGHGWARQTAPGQSAAAVYLTIVNRGEGGDRLERIEGAMGQATLHKSSSASGVARMRPVEGGLEIAPRATVRLDPGGTHIMLTRLKQPLRAGETIALTLDFARSGKRPIAVRIVPASGGEAHSGHGMSL